jgi:hypothetical protein
LALCNQFFQFEKPGAHIVIASKHLFHAFNNTANRAVVVDLKMADNFL